MLPEERRRTVLTVLRCEGKIVASELSARLEVSEDTIRRDLRELAEAGLLRRVHGGALPPSPSSPMYSARQREAPVAKAAIGRTAAGLVQPGQVVFLDAGTTALQLAHSLSPDLHATIVTNSPPAALALAEHEHIDVIFLGGRLLKPSLATVGVGTVRTIESIRADICFLGVAALHPEVGVSVLVFEEAELKAAMAAHSKQVVALAAGDKLGTAAPFLVGPLTMLTHIITERSVVENVLQPYRDLGLTVITA